VDRRDPTFRATSSARESVYPMKPTILVLLLVTAALAEEVAVWGTR
jgi:hypothetical protein